MGRGPAHQRPTRNNPPVRLPIFFSLRAISAAGARGRSARGGASSRRGLQEDGRSGTGERAKIEGWSGGSDNASNAETDEDGLPAWEQGWGNDTLTASPWGTQEIGAGGLRVDAWAGGSDGQKAPSVTADKAGTQGRHGARQGQQDKNRGRREFEGAEPSGVGGKLWGPRGLQSGPRYPRSGGGGRGGARPLEWWKTLVGAATEWARESSCLRATRPP